MSGQPLSPQFGAVNQNREWRLTPIDWEVAFPRSPQHLSNQLRGKRFNSDRPQLQLFDDTYHGLPAHIRSEVDRHNIGDIGFNLSISQQRAYEAALFLLTATGGKTERVVITPEDWLRAYGVEKRQRNTRDSAEMSSYDREEAFKALATLGVMPWFFCYDACVDGKWKSRQEVAPLWTVGTEKDISEPQSPAAVRQLSSQDIALFIQSLKDAQRISIKFHNIWFDQHDSFYFYKPAHLYQRLSLAISGNIRRHNKHTHNLIDWIFSEVGRIRVEERQQHAAHGSGYQPKEFWTFSEDIAALAIQLRMTAQVSKRNWARIRTSISDSALLAQQAQIISNFKLEADRLSVTFHSRTFADLDQYHKSLEAKHAERAQRAARARSRPQFDGIAWPFARPINNYSHPQLKDMKKSQQEELLKIKEKLRLEGTREQNSPYRQISRKPTTEEAYAVHYHESVIRMIDQELVPRPQAQ